MISSTLTLRQIQRLEFDILKFFRDVCESNNLRYYLAYGTLIGAIRHQGFIPWDDDIDVMMPREDYYKLVEIISNSQHEYYRLVAMETNDSFTAPLPKIIDSRTCLVQHYDYLEKVDLGVYIDIFMLDGARNSYDDALKWYDQSFKYYKDWRKADLALFPPGKSKLYGVLRYIKNFPYKIHPISFYLQRMKENNSRFSFYDCDYVSTLEVGTLPSTKCIWPKDYFEPGIKKEFEGEEFIVPNNFDSVLKSEYGDYMKLPPAEKQKPHHVYTLMVDENLLKLMNDKEYSEL